VCVLVCAVDGCVHLVYCVIALFSCGQLSFLPFDFFSSFYFYSHATNVHHRLMQGSDTTRPFLEMIVPSNMPDYLFTIRTFVLSSEHLCIHDHSPKDTDELCREHTKDRTSLYSLCAFLSIVAGLD